MRYLSPQVKCSRCRLALIYRRAVFQKLFVSAAPQRCKRGRDVLVIPTTLPQRLRTSNTMVRRHKFRVEYSIQWFASVTRTIAQFAVGVRLGSTFRSTESINKARPAIKVDLEHRRDSEPWAQRTRRRTTTLRYGHNLLLCAWVYRGRARDLERFVVVATDTVADDFRPCVDVPLPHIGYGRGCRVLPKVFVAGRE